MTKVWVKLHGPPSPGDPMATGYRSNPIPTMVEADLDEVAKVALLPYNTYIYEIEEGADYLQWTRKDGLGAAKINQLKTYLNNVKNNPKYSSIATELLAILDFTSLKDVVTYCNDIITRQGATDQEKLNALLIIKIVAIVKCIF